MGEGLNFPRNKNVYTVYYWYEFIFTDIPSYTSDQSSWTWKIHESVNRTLEETNYKSSYSI